MKALVYIGNSTVSRLEIQQAASDASDIRVNVLQAGICGTDLGIVRDERPKAAPPVTLGHEFVGRRADTGEWVVANPILSCRLCRACREGRDNLCEKRQVLGFHRPGAFAEAVMVPPSNLVSISGASLEQAAMVDPIATALHAFRRTPFPQGPVAVLGAGTIGQSMLFVLKFFGVADVTVTDIVPERLEMALAGGANRVGTVAEGVHDVVYDTVGSEATRLDAVSRVRTGGTAVLLGLYSIALNVPAATLIIGGERTVTGSFAYTDAVFREAAGMVSSLDTNWVHTVDFDDAEEAFMALIQGRSNPAHVKIQMRIA